MSKKNRRRQEFQTQQRTESPVSSETEQTTEVQTQDALTEAELEREIVEESIQVATRKNLSFERHHKLCLELVELRRQRLSDQ